jgi:hypothetical protein
VYARDARPVDGALAELTLERGPGNEGYKASLHTSFYDRINGKEVTETKVVSVHLACAFDRASAEARCSRDARPVDGALVELNVLEGKADGYDVTLAATGSYDPTTVTKTLATNIAFVSDKLVVAGGPSTPAIIPQGVVSQAVYAVDGRPVDGALTEITFTLKDKTYEATLHTSFYDRIGGKEVSQTRSLGVGLDCTFDRFTAEASCSRDQRPVDGSLNEIKLVKSTIGTDRFDATQSVTGARVPTTETKELGFGLAFEKNKLQVIQPQH